MPDFLHADVQCRRPCVSKPKEVFISPSRTCRRIHIHTLQQMVLIQWGMHAEKCLCLTWIPWRLSLRCGMLFLSWDLRVWARLPEQWSSACQHADFSPLCIWLPWLSAATFPNSRWEMFLFQYVHVCVWASFCSCESDFINGWWSCLPWACVPLQFKQDEWQLTLDICQSREAKS